MRKVWEWDIMSAEMKRRYSPRPALPRPGQRPAFRTVTSYIPEPDL